MLPDDEITNIQGMTGQEARNWLRTDGSGIFKAFRAGVDALNYFREGFGHISTQAFYQIRREVLSLSEMTLSFSQLDPQSLIPQAYHVTDHGLNLSAEYEYRIQEFGYNPETGEIKQQWITVASDRQLDRNSLEATARMYLGEGGESGNMILEAFGDVQALRRS